MSNSKLVMSQAANSWEGPTYIEDVFSIYFHNGTSATQTITNGIDLAGEGGLVWIKSRTVARANMFFDTERGVHKYLMSQSTNPEATASTSLTAFNANGFTLGSDSTGDVNYTGNGGYASWTFRKAPRFFDVVTYTGNGVNNTNIPHNLGVVPGAVFFKKTSGVGDWLVSHRSLGDFFTAILNSTSAAQNFGTTWTGNTDTNLNLNNNVNENGATYVAYLFAHDPLGPSGDGSDGLIACGSYTGNGLGYLSGGNSIDIGFEPQWVMIFPATVSGYGATIFDVMRGMVEGNVPQDYFLQPSSSAAEASYSAYIAPTSTGFKLETSGGYVNENGSTYIYIAIRRGPMRQPTAGTEVFDVASWTGGSSLPTAKSGFPVDMAIWKDTDGSDGYAADRMRGRVILRTNTTDAESSSSSYGFDYQNGYLDVASTDATRYSWMFRRAPNFFDVVAYTGTGTNTTIKHNLGVKPQMIWVKGRNDTTFGWYVYNETVTAADQLYLHLSNAAGGGFMNNTEPNDTEFTLGVTSGANASGEPYIAYLFASLDGVSKVGSYTGNGSSQTIDCGFTGGARFILIKRTDSTGDWYVWDTARGIVAGNDPHLSLNTTAAEVTSDDSIDPDSSGFIVNQDAATNVNVSSASYIYLAIA